VRPAPVAPAPRATPARAGRVLVIDDEKMIGEAITEALRGHLVVPATSARAALDRLIGGERFDVIFCDLLMPDMTGMEFFEEVERQLPAETGRIVFLTGGAFTPRSREFLARIPNPTLEKPFELRQLVTLVNERLR